MLSLNEGIFPSMFKFYALILKAGCTLFVSNYRPIAIQSYISKLFESLVLKFIQLSVNGIILVLIKKQHGFRPGRSTTTCNILLSNYIYNSFQYRSKAYIIYADF